MIASDAKDLAVKYGVKQAPTLVLVHGDEIENSGANTSVASATFSVDDKKLMTVSKDGVVVVRNLHLEGNE